MVFAEPIAGLFISKEMTDLLSYTTVVFRIFALSFLIVGYNVVIGGYFIAVEESFYATMISLSRGIVTLTICLLIMTALFQGAGIWWTPLVSECVTLLITVGALMLYKRKSAR